MPNNKLKIINSDHVLVCDKELKAYMYDPPFKDGSTIVVEATSDPANQYQQKLLPTELHGLIGGNLPKGFQLIIYRPEARTKGLEYVSFENISYGRRINLSIYYYFNDWTLRTNLVYFAEDFRTHIEQKIFNCQSVIVTKDECGVKISCSIFLEEIEDCLEAYLRIDSEITLLYKEVIHNADKLFVKKLELYTTNRESGFKWWIRYVVVPIISGGIGAALIGWLLFNG